MSMSDMCDKIKSRLFDYIDGELDEASKAELEEHLGKCPECRKEFQDCLETVKLLHSAREIPPIDIASSVMTKVRSMSKANNKLRRMRILTSIAASVVAVTALTAIAVKISPYLIDNKKVDDASPESGAHLYASYDYGTNAVEKSDSIVFDEAEQEELEISEVEVEEANELAIFDSYDDGAGADADADATSEETVPETLKLTCTKSYSASVEAEAQAGEAEEEADECIPECVITEQSNEYCTNASMRNLLYNYNIEAESVILNSKLGNISNSVMEPFVLD